MMHYTGERVVPWNLTAGVEIFHHHIARYAWAIPQVFNKYVVDLGCGCGYGSFLLSWAARGVLGVDVSEEAVGFAKEHFKADNLTYSVGDITRTFFGADVYIAFEVLEHLQHPEKILNKFRPLVWSIPVNDKSLFHLHTYSVGEIEELTNTGEWFQDKDGLIVRREVAWSAPRYVLGVTA